MTIETETGEYYGENTPLLFPSLRPQLKDLSAKGPYNDTREDKSETGFSRALKKSCTRYFGILLAIFASFLLSLTTLIARLLIEYHPFNEALWRFLGILLPSVPILFWNSLKTKENVLGSVYPCCDSSKLKTFLVIFVSFTI